MPQSLSNILVHPVFSTKYRQPLLHAPIRERAHPYMASIIRELGCECYRAGGVEDHVHFAIRLSRVLAISELVEKLKTGSSRWMKTQGTELSKCSWQKGYGAFSADYRAKEILTNYIDRQVEHHHKTSFQEEYRSLLTENEVEWDERYAWD